VDITVKVKYQISRPIAEVFEAIVNPEKLASYFTSEPSGALSAGTTVVWKFSDAGQEEKVTISEINFNEHIKFKWHASGEKTSVDIYLRQLTLLTTEITIEEYGWPLDKQGVKKAMQQTQGWTDFICSLKAYLVCGIRLREDSPQAKAVISKP
jgi:uncharacterized protein YndB with AHSA1/START domain